MDHPMIRRGRVRYSRREGKQTTSARGVGWRVEAGGLEGLGRGWTGRWLFCVRWYWVALEQASVCLLGALLLARGLGRVLGSWDRGRPSRGPGYGVEAVGTTGGSLGCALTGGRCGRPWGVSRLAWVPGIGESLVDSGIVSIHQRRGLARSEP